MSKKLDLFMGTRYPVDSFHSTLQTFLTKKRKGGISEFTVQRYFFNLFPMGEELGNPAIKTVKRDFVKQYVDRLWARYARDTVRTAVGDIRHFFLWCKKKKRTKKNLAKHIKPVARKVHIVRRSKAVPEADILTVLAHLTEQLGEKVYRDLFGVLTLTDEALTNTELTALRDLFALTFLYETGARVGELSKLGTAVMNKATRVPATVYYVTVSGKVGAPDRYFTERTAEVWRLFSQVKPVSMYAVPKWRTGEVDLLKPHSISYMCLRRAKGAGVSPFRANSLRHAKVKRSRQLVGLEMASLLVDHSDLNTTWGYANFDGVELAEAVSATGLLFDFWSK